MTCKIKGFCGAECRKTRGKYRGVRRTTLLIMQNTHFVQLGGAAGASEHSQEGCIFVKYLKF